MFGHNYLASGQVLVLANVHVYCEVNSVAIGIKGNLAGTAFKRICLWYGAIDETEET